LARREDRKLLVYVEQCGKTEDRAIRSYHEDLRTNGTGFDTQRSSKYGPMSSEELRNVLIKRPSFVTKQNPLCQMSDIVLFPVVKGKYDPTYRPYLRFCQEKKRIDDILEESDVGKMGIKYSCFDDI
jgi:hypothetical protein